MEKILIGAVAGIFVGAFAMEMLHRGSPRTIKAVEDKASKVANLLTDGFREGYEGSKEPAPQEN